MLCLSKVNITSSSVYDYSLKSFNLMNLQLPRTMTQTRAQDTGKEHAKERLPSRIVSFDNNRLKEYVCLKRATPGS